MTAIVLNTQNFIVLRIHGTIPAFKNKKRSILDRNTGHQRTLTDPKTKRWMDECIRSLSYQLLSQCQTIEGGTSTESLQRFLTVSVPPDDSWQFIPEIHIKAVTGGEPGAEITITRIL